MKHIPYFEAGKGWYYTNTNIVVLGLIAEHVTGQPMSKLYENIIFKPLDMKNTSVPVLNNMPDPKSEGYMYGYISRKDAPTSVIREVSTYYSPSWASY